MRQPSYIEAPTPTIEAVAKALHDSCVPDHATYPFEGRPVAERRAFWKQAEAAITAYNKAVRG